MITTVTMNTSIDKAYFMDHEVQNGTVMRVSRCRNSAGGKGLNVARAVKLCGEKVQATGLAGGFNGKYLEHYHYADCFRPAISGYIDAVLYVRYQ